ncbi:MAG TPA: hypothetical protein VKB78_05715 [Pirellulales bacterium]|nr:hypothetical protein [Pirellulales bacterium]
MLRSVFVGSLLAALCLLTLPRAVADDDLPVFRQRRFEPFVTPDPRRCAPSLFEAIDSGLLPPFGWGWGWGWGWGGFGWRGYWPWGGFGVRNGGYGVPFSPSGYHRYPYPYGYNGRFWFPNGPTWPYGSLAPFLWNDFGPLPPLAYSIHPLYPPYFPFAPGFPAGDEAEHYGEYYW